MRPGDTAKVEGTVYQIRLDVEDEAKGIYHYVISPGSREDARVTLQRHGGIAIEIMDETGKKIFKEKGWTGRVWFYNDCARAVRDAISLALDQSRSWAEASRNSRKSQEEIDAVVREYCPASNPLDLNRDKTVIFIKNCRWRPGEDYGVDVFYQGRWLRLGHTDMVDDIRTSVSAASNGDPGHIDFWRSSVEECYGARISDSDFSIVDAMTDG